MSTHLPTTTQRVAQHTSCQANSEIREKTINDLRSVQDANVGIIDQRLRMLQEEWDIERALETSASAIVIGSSVLGLFFSKKWLLLTCAVGGYLLNHALNGWCPPVPLFRRMGIRTASEIANERTVLKMMRKDFDHLPQDVREMLAISEK